MRRVALTLAVFVALTAPALAQRASIDRVNARLATLAAKGDAAGIAALYTSDATILPAGGDLVQGRAAILDYWEQTLPTITNFKTITVDVKRLGADYVREIGTFRFKAKAGQQEVVGKYVVLWRRSGKSWQIFTDIWNANK
jgi:uncharacterized protein (TIGR02246 family)